LAIALALYWLRIFGIGAGYTATSQTAAPIEPAAKSGSKERAVVGVEAPSSSSQFWYWPLSGPF
jgi:hypothetical protein